MHLHAPAAEAEARHGGCSGACHTCGGRPAPDCADSSIRGARMGLASMLVFLLPLGAACAGARIAGPDSPAQLGGALIGLFGGILAAQLCVACIRSLREEHP